MKLFFPSRIRVEKMENEQHCSQRYWELMKKGNQLARIKLKQKLAANVSITNDIQHRLKAKRYALNVDSRKCHQILCKDFIKQY